MRRIALLVLVLLVAACARTTPLPGLHIGAGGRIERTTPADVLTRSQAILAEDLGAALGAGWSAEVAIEPPPQEDHDYSDQRHWYWDEVTVTVKVVGEGEVPLSTASIGAIVAARLEPHLRRPKALKVAVVR